MARITAHSPSTLILSITVRLLIIRDRREILMEICIGKDSNRGNERKERGEREEEDLHKKEKVRENENRE